MADQDSGTSCVERYAQLISLAVHELRTPASVISGYLRLLQRETHPPLNDRQRKMVDEADKSSQRLAELIAELGEIGKLDDGRSPLKREAFELFSMLQQVVQESSEGIDRGVRLSLRAEPSAARVVGDCVRLRRAFSAFSRAVLREQPDSTNVVLLRQTVTNTAAPFALIVIAREDDVEQSLEAEPLPLDEKRGGLGLSLPIARRLVEGHGGRVWTPLSKTADTSARGAILVSIPLLQS